MSFKKSIISGAAALALASTVAFSAIESDGTGDYLLMPAYYAMGTWSTTVKVVNTNLTHAIVAKVVVREHNNSEEILDFPIYLTPGDVWDGTIYDDGNYVRFNSTDDSMIQMDAAGNIQYGHIEPNGITTPHLINNVSPNTTGYIEVFGLVSYPATQIDPTWTSGPLDKELFFNYARNTADRKDLFQDNTTVDVTNDDLLGKQTIEAQAGAVTDSRFMMLNALALGNMGVNTGGATTYWSDVIGTETTLDSVADDTASLRMMEEALSKDVIYVMYEGDKAEVNPMAVIFTDPTKKYHADQGVADLAANGYVQDANSAWYYTFHEVARNMVELPDSCEEEGGDDWSNFDGNETNCTRRVYTEKHQINRIDSLGIVDEGLEFAFPAGGYLSYYIDHNISIVPTSIMGKEMFEDVYFNNHLYNQYKVGTGTMSEYPADNVQ